MNRSDKVVVKAAKRLGDAMFKNIVVVLREQHIGKVICGVFVYFAIKAVADALEAPFLNRVIHLFNAHTSEFPHTEPSVYGLEIALKSFDVVLFAVLAWVFYRWFWSQQEGEPRG